MSNKKSPLQSVKISKIIYPTLIGIGVVIFLMVRNFDITAFEIVKFTYRSVFWMFIGLILLIIRDIGYITRLRILTDNELGWIQAIRVILLWEFTSAITPSAIGGTSVAVIYVNKEGINLGKSTAVVMTTSFLDELYFVLMFPLLIMLVNQANLFAIGGGFSLSNPFVLAAFIGYGLKTLWVMLVAYGLFINPRGFKMLLLFVFKLPFLRKWRDTASKTGDDIIKSSKEFQTKKTVFWVKAFGATFFSWTARYWIVNALFLAFFDVQNHFLLFARQLVMWLMMLVSPTPGGSGLSEYVFTEYLGDFLPTAGVAALLALLWRLYTYYPYLIIGALILPKWLRSKFKKPHLKLKKHS